MTERVASTMGSGSGVHKRVERRDWLDAILADPTADGPRLVYADHLTAHGDPRGEFIRLQCLLGRTLHGTNGSVVSEPTRDAVNAEALMARESALLAQHAEAWLAGLEPLKGGALAWRRGFPVKGSLPAHTFAAFARVPLEQVLLTDFKAKEVESLMKGAPHPTVHAFRFGSGFSDATCRVLNAPLFSRAVTLDFSASECTGTALFDELMKAKFPKLSQLVLSGTPVDDAHLARLSTTKFWRRIDTLELAHTPQLTAAMASSLATATGLRTLRLARVLDEAWAVSLLRHAPLTLRTLAASVEILPPMLRAQLHKRFSFEA